MVAPKDISNYALSQNSTISFSSPLLAFYFEAIKKLDTLHYSNAIKKHPLLFPITKTMTLYFDQGTYMGYETVKIKADTSKKCSQLYFIFKFELPHYYLVNSKNS